MRQPVRTGNGFAGYFPPPGRPGFASRSKIAGSRHPPLCFGRDRSRFRGAGAVRPPLFVAMKAAMGAVDPPRARHHEHRS